MLFSSMIRLTTHIADNLVSELILPVPRVLQVAPQPFHVALQLYNNWRDFAYVTVSGGTSVAADILRPTATHTAAILASAEKNAKF